MLHHKYFKPAVAKWQDLLFGAFRTPTWDRLQVLILYGLLAIGAFGVLYVMFAALVHVGDTPEAGGRLVQGTHLKNFEFQPKPARLPAIEFVNGEGNAVHLSDFRGKVVLLNLWATWCAPCVSEMPSLDALQKGFADAPFEVVAVSADFHGLDAVNRFYAEHEIRSLKAYSDRTGRLSRELANGALPVSLLIGPDGREIGRLLGAADWGGGPARRLIREALQLVAQN